MPASHQFPVREHQIEIWPSEQNAGNEAPEPGLVLVFDVLVDLGRIVTDRRECVGVLPLLGRPLRLDVREAVFRNVLMDRRPTQRQGTNPKSKSGNGALGQGFDLVKPHDRRWWSQAFECARVVMKLLDRLQWSLDSELEIKNWHGSESLDPSGYVDHKQGTLHQSILDAVLGAAMRYVAE